MPVSHTKTSHIWKYVIAVAACFCIIVNSGLFIYHQNSQPEDITDLHEIIQNGNNSEIIQAGGFELFDSVKIEESQLAKNFNTEATLPIYTVVSDSIFDSDTVNQFAESAANAGWFTDYTVEYQNGIYSIINKECSSTPANVSEMGGREITDQFLNDAGISEWLNSQSIVVKFGDRHSDTVPVKYYYLMIDGRYFADCIQLFTDDNGVVLRCNLAIHEYEKSEEVFPALPFAEALTSTFCLPGNKTTAALKIYTSELSYIAGLPVYVLSGIVEDNTPITAFAAAFEIDNLQHVTLIYEILK